MRLAMEKRWEGLGPKQSVSGRPYFHVLRGLRSRRGCSTNRSEVAVVDG